MLIDDGKRQRTSTLDCERRSGDELLLRLLRLDLDDVTDIDAGDFGGLCIVNSPVTLLDISRTLIIYYRPRWPAATGLVPLWQPAKYV